MKLLKKYFSFNKNEENFYTFVKKLYNGRAQRIRKRRRKDGS